MINRPNSLLTALLVATVGCGGHNAPPADVSNDIKRIAGQTKELETILSETGLADGIKAWKLTNDPLVEHYASLAIRNGGYYVYHTIMPPLDTGNMRGGGLSEIAISSRGRIISKEYLLDSPVGPTINLTLEVKPAQDFIAVSGDGKVVFVAELLGGVGDQIGLVIFDPKDHSYNRVCNMKNGLTNDFSLLGFLGKTIYFTIGDNKFYQVAVGGKPVRAGNLPRSVEARIERISELQQQLGQILGHENVKVHNYIATTADSYDILISHQRNGQWDIYLVRDFNYKLPSAGRNLPFGRPGAFSLYPQSPYGIQSSTNPIRHWPWYDRGRLR